MKTITLTQGFHALIDDEDFDWLNRYKWNYHNGYARRTNDGYDTVHMHVEIAQKHGIEIYPELDHKDRNGINNQKENLRPATRSQQGANRDLFPNNSTGYKGVSWHRGKWQSSIRREGRLHYLGRFSDIIAAAKAYDAAAIVYFGEHACLNFGGK
jgi:hypothetical protein